MRYVLRFHFTKRLTRVQMVHKTYDYRMVAERLEAFKDGVSVGDLPEYHGGHVGIPLINWCFKALNDERLFWSVD